jgi:hypothetical protein
VRIGRETLRNQINNFPKLKNGEIFQMAIAKLETELLNIAKDVKAGLEAAGEDAIKLASFLEANSSKITALASLAGPQAAAVTTTGISLVNLAITAVKDAGASAAANGVNVKLDSAAVADVKAVIAAIEKI